ncbi:VanW family protein [Clostridium aciditolerans]|uniref:VanW family protein n=1 Tax=Clostridium aciditolerans TaxID=339861 RepID=A0A934M2G4_9CLOT|nr:VanW family protein [Clostridium aciditolerans]MBI6872112.1 VanW family protein [Clostridium aciditolerans]
MRKNKLILLFSILILTICFSIGCKTNKSAPKGSTNTPNSNSEQVKEGSEPQEKKQAPPSKAELVPEPKAGTESKPAPEPKPTPESKPAPEPKPVPKPAPKPTPKSDPKPEQPRSQNSENKVLATFSTTILDSDENRVNNIRLASQKINGFVLKPGETFSFNKIVGKRDYNKGYKKAKVLVNGESNEGVGGGICQLSSTIYNAALKSGMQIIERHTHSGEVGYIPRGQDAAVSYGYKDLKFKNLNSYPVKFIVNIKNGKVYVSTIKSM